MLPASVLFLISELPVPEVEVLPVSVLFLISVLPEFLLSLFEPVFLSVSRFLISVFSGFEYRSVPVVELLFSFLFTLTGRVVPEGSAVLPERVFTSIPVLLVLPVSGLDSRVRLIPGSFS